MLEQVLFIIMCAIIVMVISAGSYAKGRIDHEKETSKRREGTDLAKIPGTIEWSIAGMNGTLEKFTVEEIEEIEDQEEQEHEDQGEMLAQRQALRRKYQMS